MNRQKWLGIAGLLAGLAVVGTGFQNCGKGFAPADSGFTDASSSGDPSAGNGGNTNGGGNVNQPPATPPPYQIQNRWEAPTTTGTPGRRTDLSAVWTGTRVLLFGGEVGQVVATNELYSFDPATATYTSIPVPGNIGARAYHRGIWTGNRMIVWGGFTTNNRVYQPLATGHSYDPATNIWTNIAAFNGAQLPLNPAIVWTGTKMLAWGRRGSGDVGAGAIYDPATDTWVAMSRTNAPSSDGASWIQGTWTGTRFMTLDYAQNGNTRTHRMYSYDPATDTWSFTDQPNAPTPWNVQSFWTGTQIIYYGGFYRTNPIGNGAGVTTQQTWAYTPATNTWQQLMASPYYRVQVAGAWLGNRLFIFSGWCQDQNNGPRLGSCAGANDQFTNDLMYFY